MVENKTLFCILGAPISFLPSVIVNIITSSHFLCYKIIVLSISYLPPSKRERTVQNVKLFHVSYYLPKSDTETGITNKILIEEEIYVEGG